METTSLFQQRKCEQEEETAQKPTYEIRLMLFQLEEGWGAGYVVLPVDTLLRTEGTKVSALSQLEITFSINAQLLLQTVLKVSAKTVCPEEDALFVTEPR